MAMWFGIESVWEVGYVIFTPSFLLGKSFNLYAPDFFYFMFKKWARRAKWPDILGVLSHKLMVTYSYLEII